MHQEAISKALQESSTIQQGLPDLPGLQVKSWVFLPLLPLDRNLTLGWAMAQEEAKLVSTELDTRVATGNNNNNVRRPKYQRKSRSHFNRIKSSPELLLLRAEQVSWAEAVTRRLEAFQPRPLVLQMDGPKPQVVALVSCNARLQHPMWQELQVPRRMVSLSLMGGARAGDEAEGAIRVVTNPHQCNFVVSSIRMKDTDIAHHFI